MREYRAIGAPHDGMAEHAHIRLQFDGLAFRAIHGKAQCFSWFTAN